MNEEACAQSVPTTQQKGKVCPLLPAVGPPVSALDPHARVPSTESAGKAITWSQEPCAPCVCTHPLPCTLAQLWFQAQERCATNGRDAALIECFATRGRLHNKWVHEYMSRRYSVIGGVCVWLCGGAFLCLGLREMYRETCGDLTRACGLRWGTAHS